MDSARASSGLLRLQKPSLADWI